MLEWYRRLPSPPAPPPGNQLVQLVVHARHPEVRLPLERLAQVVHPMLPVLQELDDGGG